MWLNEKEPCAFKCPSFLCEVFYGDDAISNVKVDHHTALVLYTVKRTICVLLYTLRELILCCALFKKTVVVQ